MFASELVPSWHRLSIERRRARLRAALFNMPLIRARHLARVLKCSPDTVAKLHVTYDSDVTEALLLFQQLRARWFGGKVVKWETAVGCRSAYLADVERLSAVAVSDQRP